MYGVYGGLHIAPFGPLQEKGEKIVKGMAEFNFQKVACNHCTGLPAVQKMIDLGYPVVRGSGRYGSQSKLYVGNGDEVIFA
jgi:7,8-dihydropterin-6-yl-methyl-4-(beta-D-ribofuranosyl)aminobenzene 5'-phosphate synthase